MQDKIKELTRQHNRLLNILLALYVTLCLIFALLYNGFFINPKAYGMDNENFNLNFSVSAVSGGDTEVSNFNWTYESSIYRSVFIKLSEEEINEVLGNNNGISYNDGYILLHNPYSYGGSFTKTGQTGGIGFVSWESGYSYAFTNKVNQEFNTDYVGASILFGVSGMNNNQSFSSTVSLTSDVELQYVDSWEDAKEYLINGNDDVLKLGDPNAPPKEVTDSNIPTPQKVKIINDGKCPTIAWDNPKRALQFGDKLKVKIDFKPTFTLWMGLSPISEELVCQDWIVAFEDYLNNHNAFSIKQDSSSQLPNDLNAYNFIVDDQYIFDTTPIEDYAKSYIKYVIDQNGNTNLIPYGVGTPPTSATKMQKKLNAKSGVVGGELGDSIWDTLAPEALATIKGLFDGGQTRNCQFRIRYEVEDGDKVLVSPWVNASKEFDVNGNSTSDTNISFTDKDNTPIQNPTYLPATSTNVTPVSSDAWWMNFNGYTGTMFENLTQQMSDWTGDTGGFVGFFGELFNEFPFLSWCLLFSLSLAIFLRIFGR